MSKVEHLYVHVPFCAAKCQYCAFYSEAGSAEKMGAYVEEVIRELEEFVGRESPSCRVRAEGGGITTVAAGSLNDRHSRPTMAALEPKTIFFGGGTPSLLPAALMRRILERIPAQKATEWTVECNPATVSMEKAKLFREFGVNRISLGVQALDDAMLAVLGRVHTEDSAVRSYEKLRAAGFDNINLDLMFGLPGQTRADWEETLRRAIALGPEHLSTYCLILEEDTEFWRLFQAGHIKPNEEQELAMYQTGMEMLAGAGYRQYEISNFAKPGRECRHNLAYWEGKDYLGIGPSACSTIGDRRWQNTAEVEGWKPGSVEEITPELRAAERAAFGMRMNAGVPAELVRGRWDRQVAELLLAELVQWRDGRLQPTPRGILFADEVAAEFL
jgi:oxygen-independent coproporphyrinogen-3 oxidase